MKNTGKLMLTLLCSMIVISAGCSDPAQTVSADRPDRAELDGTWRFVLDSPGGELPFVVHMTGFGSQSPAAVIHNGAEQLPFTTVITNGTNLELGFSHYDSWLRGEVQEDGSIAGSWDRRSPDGERTRMSFTARRGESRFPAPDAEPASFEGVWSVTFADDGGTYPAQGEFDQDGSRITGTFLTETGDYRYLEGRVDGNTMRLSTFDGAHAFLFDATLQENGHLKGNFWSRDSYHATWSAEKGQADLGNAFEMTRLTSSDGRFRFSFPDVDGNEISNNDPRFEGKAVIVMVFGTWCPNCNDEAVLLKQLYDQYHSQGLEMVGLANEFAPDFEGRAEMVRAFARRYDIPWPLLIVGTADKTETSQRLGDIDKITSYPTTVFIDRQGVVQAIHTGFSGPGTGSHYKDLVAEFHENVQQILQ